MHQVLQPGRREGLKLVIEIYRVGSGGVPDQ